MNIILEIETIIEKIKCNLFHRKYHGITLTFRSEKIGFCKKCYIRFKVNERSIKRINKNR